MHDRDLRKLAHDLYNPTDGYGINLRSMTVSKAAPVITTELIVRVYLAMVAYRRTTTFALQLDKA